MRELVQKILDARNDALRNKYNLRTIEHRGGRMVYYVNLRRVEFVSHEKNGAAWVDFHQATKYLGLERKWQDSHHIRYPESKILI